MQQGKSVVYVKEQLGFASIQITVGTYGHLIPALGRERKGRHRTAPSHRRSGLLPPGWHVQRQQLPTGDELSLGLVSRQRDLDVEQEPAVPEDV